MSLTKAVHVRFWKSMGERFGKRWIDEYGDIPTRAWCDLIDRFTQDDIAEALLRLKDRAEHNRAYPPTHAEFEALLSKAAKLHEKPSQDFARGYWRSVIVHHVGRNLGYSFDELEPVIISNRQTLGASMRALLDKFDDLEKRTGQRTEGMYAACVDECLVLSEAFPQLETQYSFQGLIRQMQTRAIAEVGNGAAAR